jgi:hypothetical protein
LWPDGAVGLLVIDNDLTRIVVDVSVMSNDLPLINNHLELLAIDAPSQSMQFGDLRDPSSLHISTVPWNTSYCAISGGTLKPCNHAGFRELFHCSIDSLISTFTHTCFTNSKF